ncbi:hypothetical protein [Actinomadura nitritigenes]
MALVMVEIGQPPIADDEIRVDDVDTLMEGDACSCSAGDDNPN